MSSISPSRLDAIYRSIIKSKFFTNGWGDTDKLKVIFRTRKIVSNKVLCNQMISKDLEIEVGPETESTSTYSVFEGKFKCPMTPYLGDIIPPESQNANFQMILPKEWANPKIKPVVIHLAGTGDHYFGKRRVLMAKPLLKEFGIGSIILENPFYGYRKPADQKRSSLRNVSDVFVMGGCLILECIALFNWCNKNGFGPLGVTGISMGGHNAALAGASYDQPVSIIPCLSWTTASRSFTEGVIAGAVCWDVLETQYSSYGDDCVTELKSMIESPELDNNELFRAGRQFAKEYPSGIAALDAAADAASKVTQSLDISNNTGTNGKGRADAINFMRGIMDECTHLGNFSRPVDPELAFIVTASRDGYVPAIGSIPVTDLWNGCTHRNIPDHGHVSAILFKADVFRKAIADSFDLNCRKYHNCSLFHKDDSKQDAQ